MTTRSVTRLALAVALSLTCTAAFGAGGGDYLRIALLREPATADAQLTADSYCVPLNIYDRLVESQTTKTGFSQLVPGLAEKWDVSADGLVYTFYLRRGVRFSDGEVLKADDVLFTFDRMLDPATKAINTDFLDMIAGAAERMGGRASSVSGLQVLDDHTIRIRLAKPFGPFVANLASPACSIYERRATVAAGSRFGLDPARTVGTGAFTLESWTADGRLRLKAKPDYFRGKPSVAGVEFRVVPDAGAQRRLFEAGELDILDLDYAQTQAPYFLGSGTWKNFIASGPRGGIHYLALNEAIKPLGDPRIRKALQLGIDRKAILDGIYGGRGSLENGIFPRGLIAHNPELPAIPFDPGRARALIVEAGYPNGFDLELAAVRDGGPTLRICEALQAMLAELGLRVRITQMDPAAYLAARKEGRLPSYEAEWSADYNDPDNFIYTFFSEKNTAARSCNYRNKAVFARIEEARTMADQARRLKVYQALERTVVQDDAAWVPLFSLDHLFVLQPRVKNFKVSWNGWSDMPYYGVSLSQ
ncbi:MAG TPA: ABC transporter substrate-binding protein [Rectinemataceae bacterium]|nr:ABC transporter substrate-binding protein [Rectinemataceae bacterium]